jgi:hypothetical protein
LFFFNFKFLIKGLKMIHYVGGRIILRRIFRKWEAGFGDWMELAQDRDR